MLKLQNSSAINYSSFLYIFCQTLHKSRSFVCRCPDTSIQPILSCIWDGTEPGRALSFLLITQPRVSGLCWSGLWLPLRSSRLRGLQGERKITPKNYTVMQHGEEKWWGKSCLLTCRNSGIHINTLVFKRFQCFLTLLTALLTYPVFSVSVNILSLLINCCLSSHLPSSSDKPRISTANQLQFDAVK